MEIRKIQYSDGSTNQLSSFHAEESNGNTLVCLPALGVRASYYEIFATQLSRHGFNVITADWRGHGKSSVRPSRKVDFGYEIIIRDVKEILAHASTWFPNTKLFIIGHSLGGQVGSLFASRYLNIISGLILITSCSVYYKGWSGWHRVVLGLAGNCFYPLSKIIGHFPGNWVGFGGREARTLIKDWCFNARFGEYRLSNSNHDYEMSLNKLIVPVLAISIENDLLASSRAVKYLYNKFNTESDIVHLHLTSDETKIEPLDHFSWAKNPDYFVRAIKNWIHDRHSLLGMVTYGKSIQRTKQTKN